MITKNENTLFPKRLPGRPVGNTGAKRAKSVSLDQKTIEILTEFGNKNLSEGIRKAAELVDDI